MGGSSCTEEKHSVCQGKKKKENENKAAQCVKYGSHF